MTRDRDGFARHSAAVLACVTEVRDHRCDPPGTGAPTGVDEQEEFHQLLVHRWAGGLDDVHIVPSHVVTERDVAFAVGKALERRLGEANLECVGDGGTESRIRAPRHHRELHRAFLHVG